MLKREFIQYIRRLQRILLVTILAHLMVFAFIMQSIASNIRLPYSSDSRIELLPLVYNPFYGVTVYLFAPILFYRILRTLFDYRQGKMRWMLLVYTQKSHIVADTLLLATPLLVSYLISLIILYFGLQYHLQLLENQYLLLPEKYQPLATMFSMRFVFLFLYPTPVTFILFLISFYVSAATGGTSMIYTCRSEISCMSGWLYPSHLLLMYLSYTL